MERIRVVWKDSGSARAAKDIKYRKHIASGYGSGWVVNIPGDNNVYKNHYCALNAIDKALGGYGQKGGAKRIRYGIEIVGIKNETA